jgi:Ca-activated chloride channel family protein
MDDRQLKHILDGIEVPPADENARKRALNLALAEFDQARKESEKNLQGMGFWQRLTARTTQNPRREPMNRRLVYGGMATAMAVILVTAVSTQQYMGNIFHHVPALEASASKTSMTESADAAAIAAGEPQSFENASPLPAATMPAKPLAEARVRAQPMMEADKEMARRAAPPMPMAAPVAGLMAKKAEMAPAGMAGGAMTAYMDADEFSQSQAYYQDEGRDSFTKFDQNPVKAVGAEPVSTFSIDVDTSSYSFVRRQINAGVLPQKDAVRIEEMVNYFDYAYPLPESRETPFRASVAVSDSPWKQGNKLVHIGIKGYELGADAAKPHSNLVFLIDTSGSMDAPDKLPLLKNSFKLLLDTLSPDDTVGIVVYAGSAGAALEPTQVKDKAKILAALDNLSAGGSTAGAEGIRQAYQMAEAGFRKDAVNRVILATDGDFNVGITDQGELKSYIEHERESGVYLSVLGFGEGNLNDSLMQELAQNGNGAAAYIDTLNEARKVLVQEASQTLFPIAQDVKIQVEFNPATVAEYRLVGYETRALATEDFNNDKVDAGDIGAGAEVTAIYEITPVGGPTSVDASRYAQPEKAKVADAAKFGDEYAFLKIRYKLPGEKTSKLISTPITAGSKADATLARENEWATAVASFGELLKGGKYSGPVSYDDVIRMANEAKGADEFGYRSEFIQLVRLAKSVPAMQPPQGGDGGGVYPQ